jgi:uroporphyrinogen decarboxylase
MRQAGRYLPEYREVRSKVDFLTLCKTPELACKVTVQPIDRLNVDAAVIFSDILVLLEAMGMPLRFGNDHGPKIDETIQTEIHVKKLRLTEIEKNLSYVGAAVRMTTEALRDRNVPVIGFAGAPFTLACYAVEGQTSREFTKTKRFMNENPKLFEALLNKLADGVALHLRAQVEAGAKAVQLFDSWGGILSQEMYRRFVLPALQRAIQPLKKLSASVILYVNGSTPHLETMAQSGADVLSVDWRIPLSEARRRVGPKLALQGNLDPTSLFAAPETIAASTKAMLQDHQGPGYIANLGHGILPDVPVEHAKTFVETVQKWKSQK